MHLPSIYPSNSWPPLPHLSYLLVCIERAQRAPHRRVLHSICMQNHKDSTHTRRHRHTHAPLPKCPSQRECTTMYNLQDEQRRGLEHSILHRAARCDVDLSVVPWRGASCITVHTHTHTHTHTHKHKQ